MRSTVGEMVNTISHTSNEEESLIVAARSVLITDLKQQLKSERQSRGWSRGSTSNSLAHVMISDLELPAWQLEQDSWGIVTFSSLAFFKESLMLKFRATAELLTFPETFTFHIKPTDEPIKLQVFMTSMKQTTEQTSEGPVSEETPRFRLFVGINFNFNDQANNFSMKTFGDIRSLQGNVWLQWKANSFHFAFLSIGRESGFIEKNSDWYSLQGAMLHYQDSLPEQPHGTSSLRMTFKSKADPKKVNNATQRLCLNTYFDGYADSEEFSLVVETFEQLQKWRNQLTSLVTCFRLRKLFGYF